MLPKVIGTNNTIQLTNGQQRKVVLLNNAATTPPFEHTLERVTQFLQTYGAMHRGAGPHANITCNKIAEAIQTIKNFVGAGEKHGLIFTSNTSGAINLFARMQKFTREDVVFTSDTEHTSNNLPWRHNTNVEIVEIKTFTDGAIDYQDLENKIKIYRGRLKLVAITGASNMTGYIPDIERIAKLAHSCQARIFVDAAQLAPHRPINMVKDNIDALAFSAHKIYAPFGLGVLVLPTEMLNAKPLNPGGGSIDMISDYNTIWSPISERHQTGTWNTVGIIALAASCETIMRVGWQEIVGHEKNLMRYLAQKLIAVPGLKLYVPIEKFINENRIATIPFTLDGYHHALLSAILEHEYGIESRAGTICNHRLVGRWLNITDEQQKEIEEKIKNGNRLASYGVVRISLGIHNTEEDIDALANALKSISETGPKLRYQPKNETETFAPIIPDL